MYYFTVSGMECRCDTAMELVSLCQAVSCGQSERAPTKETTATTDVATREEGTTDGATKELHRAAARRVFPERNAIADLPFVEGGLSWKVVKRIAPKLNRTDIRQLRSDLKARQALGK